MRPILAEAGAPRRPRVVVLGMLGFLCCMPVSGRAGDAAADKAAADKAADESLLEFLGRGEDETAAFGEYDAGAHGGTKTPGVSENAPSGKAKDERSGTGTTS